MTELGGPIRPRAIGLRRAGLEVLAVGVPAGAVLLGAPGPFGFSVLAGLVGCALLPLRWVWAPLGVLGCLCGLVGGLGWPAALVALFGLGRRERRLRVVLPWLALCWVAAVVPVLVTQRLGWDDVVLTVAFVVLWSAAPAAVGLLIATRERLTTSLRELERARDDALVARERAARAAERARIGREIHDAVGHHATLIAVGAAALAASSDDPGVRESAEQLRTQAKRALAEMRAALGLMNGADEPSEGIGVAGLPDLVRRANVSGVRARLDVLGVAPADVPAAVGRAAYRLVQEALTNVARHAPGARVDVGLEWRRAELRVRVDNTPPAGRSGAPPSEGGTGLVGLAERLALVGGTLITQHAADGGYRVEGRLPLADCGDESPQLASDQRRWCAGGQPRTLSPGCGSAGPTARKGATGTWGAHEPVDHLL